MEPPGFHPHVVDDIFVVKNIETELTYRISLQVIAGSATLNRDYDITVRPLATIDFPPTQRKLQVFGNLLLFRILPDVFLEGEESVEISSEPVSSPGPTYVHPLAGASTTIFILDDDSKDNK